MELLDGRSPGCTNPKATGQTGAWLDTRTGARAQAHRNWLRGSWDAQREVPPKRCRNGWNCLLFVSFLYITSTTSLLPQKKHFLPYAVKEIYTTLR